MAAIKDPMSSQSAASAGAIEEDDIQRTRAEMDRTFDELGRKLAPARLLEDGWELVRDKASAGASRLWQLARDHPLPALTVGAGVTWLVIESRRGVSSLPRRWRRTGARSDGVRLGDPAARVAGGLGDRAAELGGRLERPARRARRRIVGLVDERALATGAASLALGLLAGLALPATRREDELLGETRDELLESAREAGQEAIAKGKQVAREAVERVKESVREQELTPEQLAAKARHVAQDAVDSLRDAEKSLAQSLDGSGQPAGSGSRTTTSAGGRAFEPGA